MTKQVTPQLPPLATTMTFFSLLLLFCFCFVCFICFFIFPLNFVLGKVAMVGGGSGGVVQGDGCDSDACCEVFKESIKIKICKVSIKI